MVDLDDYGYEHIGESFKKGFQMIRDISSGKLNPLKTSITKENKVLRGFLPTDLLTIAGRSGSGKTSRVIKMIDDFVDEELNPHYADRLIICYDSWEVSSERGALKLLSSRSKKSMSDLLNWEERLKEEEIKKLEFIAERYHDKNIYIREFSDSVYDWYSRKEAISKKYPYPKYQVVNICDHARLVTNENKESEEALLNSLMKANIRSKKETKSINIMLSQMNRNIENSAKNRLDIGKQLPVASDLFGSDSIFQASEFVLALHRPGSYGLTQFPMGDVNFSTGLSRIGAGDDDLMVEVVLKNRNGSIATILLNHNLAHNDFTDYKQKMTI